MRRIFTLAIVAVMLTASIAIGDVTIAFMSDARPKDHTEAELTYDFDQLLAQMDEGWTLDALQHIGDMDYIAYEGGQNTLDAYAASTASGVPLFHCIGNHELNNQYDLYDVRAAFENYPFNPVAGPEGTEHTTYYYEVGDLLVVVINVYWDGNNNGDGDWYTPSGGPDDDDSTFKYNEGDGGYIPDELYDWLANVLSTSSKTYKLVVGHEPAYPVDRHVGDSLDKDPANRDKFWNLLKAKGVTAYMTAHDHNFHLDEHDGVFEADSGVCGGHEGGDNDHFATIIYVHIDDQTGNFEFKVVHEQPDAGNWDNPVVIREILTPPSPMATNPNPADGAEDVAVDADLSWTAGAGAESHDIYFGITTPPPFIQNQAETIYAPPESLEPDTTYYWRIDEIDSEMTVHTGDVWSFTTAPVPGQASNPNPANSAQDVALDTDLSWTAGSDTASHDVYFGDSDPPPFIQNQAGTTYDPGTLAPETTYYWQVDEVGPGGLTTGLVWSFTTEPVPPATADSETPVKGTVGGSYIDTQSSDDICETITETKSGGKPSTRYSMLEHKWTINVVGGGTITFYLEACKTDSDDGDDFVFAYSTDDSTYTDMVTVTETYETVQNYVLPSSTAGTVYIRVTDTDQTAGNMSFDTISIDNMYISTGEPDTDPPAAPTGLTATSAGATQIDLDWADNTEPDLSHYSVWRSTTAGGNPDPYIEIASDVAGSEYSDTGLSPSMTYYYVVKAVDTSSNESGYSNEASATTSELTLPGQATDPTPSENQVDVNKNTVILSWTAGTDAASHDVYLGTSPDALLLVSEGQSGTIYDPGKLERQTTYHWRIDEVNAAGTTTGIAWNFTTR